MEHFLRLLEILLSWPPITLGCVIFISIFFREAFKQWIARLSIKGKFKDAEFTAQSQLVEEAKSITKEDEAIEQTAPKEAPLPVEAGTDWQKASELWRSNAYLWEYRYLNYYLVYSTQYVLDTLYNLNDVTSFASFDAWATPFIANPNERKAIIDALLQHHLVEDNGGLLKITPKGREYVEWRGKMPPLPSEPAAPKTS